MTAAQAEEAEREALVEVFGLDDLAALDDLRAAREAFEKHADRLHLVGAMVPGEVRDVRQRLGIAIIAIASGPNPGVQLALDLSGRATAASLTE